MLLTLATALSAALALTLACTSPPPAAGGTDSSGDTAPAGDTAADTGPPHAALQLGFPLPQREDFGTLVGVDHDPVDQDDTLLGRATCLDYDGRVFPHCYDQHEGSDFIMAGGFATMDAGSAPIVAAADGVVVYAEDGHYDRCHGDLGTGDVSCDGNDGVANAVILEHDDGQGGTWHTLYWHMMKDSVVVKLGQTVKRGAPLGKVGSSGYSSMPHLHFGLERMDGDQGTVVDPYAGPDSQEQSYWCDQREMDELPGDCSG